MDAPTSNHPTGRTLSDYGLGKLDDRAAREVDTHLEHCPDCRARVSEMTSDSFLNRVRDAQAARSTLGQSVPDLTMSHRGTPAGPPAAETLPPGLADHPDYEIRRELGRGGMGVVYLAHNRLMGRDEVLKVMGRHLIERPGVLDRFLREIRSVARLRHPNIVTAYSAVRVGESIVFAMEYVEGLDLSKLVKAKGPLPVGHTCHFIHQAALGLQHAHEEGLVHRDIKPANLMLSRKGDRATVKVLDFGLAKVAREEKMDGGLTNEGQALGTPDYMAPEQILDALRADVRADIYSLGCTLFYLLTGRPPFQATSLYDMYQAHISRDADPLNFVRPEVPSELAALVSKMMAKDPARRFQTPGEVAEALKPFFKKGTIPLPIPKATAPEIAGISMSTPAPTQPATALGRPAVMPEKTSRTVPAGTPWDALIDTREPQSLKEPASTEGQPDRGWSRKTWTWVASASGLAALLLGLVVYVTTNKGRIKIVVDDPKAVVQVDGETVRVEGLGEPITLRAGEHELTIKQGDKEFESRKFVVRRGDNESLRVEMQPRTAGGPPADSINGTGQALVSRPPLTDAAAKATAQRFRPGATWVGTWTFESSQLFNEEWPFVMTVTERSGDRFQAASTVIDLGKREIHSSQEGTLQGDRLESFYKGLTGARISIEGTLDGRELRIQFSGSGDKGERLSGHGTLVYQGPMESPPHPGQGLATPGNSTAEEGAERLTLLGHWDHRPGDVRRNVELMANGTVRMGGWRGIWTLDGDRLTLKWPTTNVSGQAHVDKLSLNPDRTAYIGSDPNGAKITGRRIGGGGYGGMPTVKYAVATEPAAGGIGDSPIRVANGPGQARVGEPSAPPAAASGGGLIPLFNGIDLGGWKMDPAEAGNWRVENGVLIGSGPGISHLYTSRADFKNFQLRVEARFNSAGHSAILFHSEFGATEPLGNSQYPKCFGVTINSDRTVPGNTGSVFEVGSIDEWFGEATKIPAGRWFVMDVLSRNDDLEIIVDGRRTCVLSRQIRHTDGHIVLRGGAPGASIEFRSIMIEEHASSIKPTSHEILRLVGHANRVSAVAFSPDGTRLLTGGSSLQINHQPGGSTRVHWNDYKSRLWDTSDGRNLWTIPGHRPGVRSLVFSPDGNLVASCGGWNNADDQKVSVSEVVTGRGVQSFNRSENTEKMLSMVVEFSRDGRRVLELCPNGTIRSWDLESKQQQPLISINSGDARPDSFPALLLTSDQTRMITGSKNGPVELWNLATGKRVKVFAGHAGPISSLARSADDRLILSGGSDNVARLWDVESGRQLQVLDCKQDGLGCVAISPDGRFALTGSHYGPIGLWDLKSGKVIGRLEGHALGINCLAFSPDGLRAASGSEDRTARIWDVKSAAGGIGGSPTSAVDGPGQRTR